jgi:hypothetical protein
MAWAAAKTDRFAHRSLATVAERALTLEERKAFVALADKIRRSLMVVAADASASPASATAGTAAASKPRNRHQQAPRSE